MLTSISIHDWKSVEDATLNVDPLTVLIGTNSSGKSNILDALSFLTRIANGALLTSALQGDGVLPQLRGGLDWASRRPHDLFSLSATARVNDAQDLVYKIECRVIGNPCEVVSEQLQRVGYRLDKTEKRRPPRDRCRFSGQIRPRPTRQLSRLASIIPRAVPLAS